MEKSDELSHYGVLGMKWGVSRYQNKDGTLTGAGKKRYERDKRESSGKKKGDKARQPDPNRWVREDISRSKKLVDASAGMSNKLKELNTKQMKKTSSKKMDLSSMTDQQMREKINRALLEKQYNDMFSQQKVSKGRKRVDKILEVSSDVLTVTGSALSIALAIKELTG